MAPTFANSLLIFSEIIGKFKSKFIFSNPDHEADLQIDAEEESVGQDCQEKGEGTYFAHFLAYSVIDTYEKLCIEAI